MELDFMPRSERSDCEWDRQEIFAIARAKERNPDLVCVPAGISVDCAARDSQP